MTLLITLCVICTVIMLLIQHFAVPVAHPNPISGSKYRYSAKLVFIFFCVLSFVSSFRYGFSDTGVYRDLCKQIGVEYDNAFSESFAIHDYGFNLLMVFLNRIGLDSQSIIIVTSVLIFGIYIYSAYKYSADLPLSLFFLIFVSYYGMINGIRQVLAGAILTLALPFLVKKKWLYYLPFVWLAYINHASAVVMLPLSLIFLGKRLNAGIVAFAAVISLFFISPGIADSLLGQIMADSTYADYLTNESKMGVMRFLVAILPLIITGLYIRSTPYRYNLPKGSAEYQQQRLIDVLINMQIVSFGFIALGLRMVYFARISMYFECATILLLPYIINHGFNQRSARLLKILIIIFYLIYFFYQTYTYVSNSALNDFRLIF